MKRELLFLCMVMGMAQLSFSQEITFQKTFSSGGYTVGRSVIETVDGGYLIAGYTEVIGAGITDMYLINTDPDGDTLWTRTYGGTGYDDAFSVQQTSDGGFVAVGYTTSFGAGGEDVFLVKTNGAGNLLWSRAYGGANGDRGAHVCQTSDGGYLIAGETLNFGAVNHDMYVIKTDSIGDTLWTKTFGGTGDDYGYGAIEYDNGVYVISGNHGTAGAWLLMLDEVGDIIWTKGYVAGGPTHLNAAYEVMKTPDGGLITSGIGYTNGMFGAVHRVDAEGNQVWTATYEGENNDYFTSMDEAAGGGYIFAGWSQSFPNGDYDSWLVRTDAAGDTLWTRTYNGGGSISSVISTWDNSYVLLGSDNFSIYLIKTDGAGDSGCGDGNSWPEIFYPEVIASDPVYIESSGGVTNDITPLIDGGGVQETLCYECDLGLVSLNSLPDTVCMDGPTWPLIGNPSGGNFMGEGVVGDDFYPAMAGEGLHTIYYVYSFSPDCSTIDSISVYVAICSSINELGKSDFFLITPNPANEYVKWTLAGAVGSPTQLRICNSMGVELVNRTEAGSTFMLDVSNWPDGFYYCQLTNAGQVGIEKFVIRH